MTATIDEAAKTLGEFEALAQSSGEWDGADPVEFSADGGAWSTVWIPTDAQPYPPFARATVSRKGATRLTTIVVSWEESVPADEEWRALWERKPMKLFGSFALRSAIRHAFRDVVGDLRGPDEDTTGPQAPTADAAPHNWDAEIGNAKTVVELDEAWAMMRLVRARTPQLEVAYKARRFELAIAEREPADPAPEIARPAPKDHLPSNRAARRAAARKKGGKR